MKKYVFWNFTIGEQFNDNSVSLTFLISLYNKGPFYHELILHLNHCWFQHLPLLHY